MPQIGLHLLRREFLDALFELVKAFGIARDILLVGQAFGDDGVEHRVQHRDIAAGLEREMFVGMPRQRLPARIHHDQLGAALGRVLEVGRGNRMVHGGIGADHDDDFGIHGGRERRRHRAGVQAFHQGCDRGSVAQPGAVIDIVGAETGAHQFLEQIGLFVGALGRAETGQRLDTLFVADFDEAFRGDIERLFPRRFAEMRKGIGRVDLVVGVLLRIRQPHQRLCQAMRMMDVIKSKAALDAEPVVIGRAVAAFSVDHLVVLDLIGDLAADAAERAQRVRPSCRHR